MPHSRSKFTFMTPPQHLDSLDPETFFAWQHKLEGIVIDVRSPLETAQGTLTKDTLEFNLYDPLFTSKIKTLDPTKHYFLYCATGNRSKAAKQLMSALGCTFVVDLQGGIVRARSEGF
ncbi:MAG: rhodanese-like domain-containing protein [Candidatus Doudnabacteria bacterium]|nr:rhodanese-like domain-containing protein [Candidatus Doudnabacteria bacterium]MCA9387899.1 rhodanese-like domain-containing protein [Candidatus Andersenbacteria bacterium]